MAEDNLLLKPVVDRESMRRAAREIGSLLFDSTSHAMRQTARITQRVMSSALRTAGREGGKALEQSYGAAASQLMDAVGAVMDSVDGTGEYLKEQAEAARKNAVMAKNFGTNKADLYIATQATERSGEDTAALIGVLGAFQDAVTTVPELENYKKRSSEMGTLDSLLLYFDKYVTNAKTPEEARIKAQLAGISPEDQVLMTGLVKELGGVTKMSQVQANRPLIMQALNNDEANFKNFKEAEQTRTKEDLIYSAGAEGASAVIVINDLDASEKNSQMNYVKDVTSGAKLKKAKIIAEKAIYDTSIDAMKKAERIANAAKKDGWGGATIQTGKEFADTFEKVGDKITGFFSADDAKPTAKPQGRE